MYIRQLRVTNYRSLKNVAIGSLSPMVTLYGHNDTGKSNILSFLEHVFSMKRIEEITEVSGGEERITRVRGFWDGEIDNFSDNFYRDTQEPITFSILLRFNRREIRSLSSLPKPFVDELPTNSNYDHLSIEGRIERSTGGRAKMVLTRALFDSRSFYESSSGDGPTYLSGFTKLTPSQAHDVFDRIMERLNGGFHLIPAARFLTPEVELPRERSAALEPSEFKNWLFQRSVNRDTEIGFRRISEQFNSPPFQHGRVSIARTGEDEIEVFVEDQSGFKLPIGRKGSGVQQILMILSHVVDSLSPLIGIEELEINLSPTTQASIFNSLLALVNSSSRRVNQIWITTHSPHIAKRNEAQRRGVWLENGETRVRRPSEAQVEQFFGFPN